MFRAVDGISFTVNRGESVGLVGESGCGKSTTSTMVMRLIDKTDGTIMFDGEDIGEIPAKQFAKLPMRRRIQMVFQDPTDSLNPRFTAARAIADPILRLSDIRGPRRHPRPLRGTGASGRPAGRTARPLSASAFRRPEGPRRHRARDRAQARSHHPRRADRGARRLGAGGRAQSAAGPQGVARDELSVRLARSQRGAAAVRPRDRHEGGQDRGGGADRTGAVRAGGAIHPRSARGDSASDLRAGARRRRRGWRPDHDAASAKGEGCAQGRRARIAQGRKAAKHRSERDPLDDFIAAGARALDLKIDKAWMPAVRGHLQVTLRLGALVAAFALPDDAEPAPVFKA